MGFGQGTNRSIIWFFSVWDFQVTSGAYVICGILLLVEYFHSLTYLFLFIWYQSCFWIQGDAFVAKGLAQVYDKPCYSGRSVVLILQVKINGEQFENRDREI
jgi:hypothetical protein